MAWPFDEDLRPFVRDLTYFVRLGYTDEQITAWAQHSHAHYDLTQVHQALPEARRAVYFATRIEQQMQRVATGGRDMSMAQLWALSARAAWYAGYGRAPTEAEREWSYTRPQSMLGLAIEVSGRGLHSGRFQHYTITVNADWTAHLSAVEDYVRTCVSEGWCLSGDMGSEALDAGSIRISMGQGALIERQRPTVTIH